MYQDIVTAVLQKEFSALKFSDCSDLEEIRSCALLRAQILDLAKKMGISSQAISEANATVQ